MKLTKKMIKETIVETLTEEPEMTLEDLIIRLNEIQALIMTNQIKDAHHFLQETIGYLRNDYGRGFDLRTLEYPEDYTQDY